MARPREFKKRVHVSVLLDESELRALDELREGKSRNKIIRGLIQRYIKRKKAVK